MSKLAIFEFTCCGKEVVHGRHQGDEMYPPSLNWCLGNCPMPLHPNGKPKGHELRFLRYEFDDTISPELLATWKFPDTTRIKKKD